MFDRLEFLLSEAWTSLTRNKGMTFASVTTSAMALFLVGGITYAYFAVARYAANIESKFEIKVFAKLDASEDDLSSLNKKLTAIPSVKTVTFQTKTEVWEQFRKTDPELTVGLGIDNPMPDTYTVTLDKIDEATKVVNTIRSFPEVEPSDGVLYRGEEQELLEKALAALRWLGIVMGGLTAAIGGILIFNTVRLTMYARKRELQIMDMVGASASTVRAPLLIEGVIHGVLGGLIATLVLWIANRVMVQLLSFVVVSRPAEGFPFGAALSILCVAGALYGFACSSLALRQPVLEEAPR